MQTVFFRVFVEICGDVYYNEHSGSDLRPIKPIGSEKAMAENKKMVEAITSMDEDFAKWYTDVVKKAELVCRLCK